MSSSVTDKKTAYTGNGTGGNNASVRAGSARALSPLKTRPRPNASAGAAFAFDLKTDSSNSASLAAANAELHTSPHGTVRSFRGTMSPSASLKETQGRHDLPTAMVPLQHSLASSAPSKSGEVVIVDSQTLAKWDLGPQNRMRPITFKANSTFKTLQAKLAGGKSFHASRPSALTIERESYMPGYTGFIRGKQHIAGRTYGETTRRALEKDYREHVCTSPVPSAPQANRKIPHRTPDESFVSNTFANRTYHIPGYTGFVPGVRSTFSQSYGATTSSALQKHFAGHGGDSRTPEKSGFAETSRKRLQLNIDNAPLPGAIKTNKPPEKLIPAHLRDLRYLAM